jgi:predicted DNA binding CopG/RHH family protein
MKYYSLTDEEQRELDEIEVALENGTLESIADFEEEKKRLQQIVRNTLNKTRNINIRLSERDLYKLKAKAIEEGMPYQTLASSILHKATAEK